MLPLRAVGSDHVVGTDFNPSTTHPHILRAVGSNHINLYMFRSYGTPILLLSSFTGLKSGATRCIAPLELICTALLHFQRFMIKSVNCLLKHANLFMVMSVALLCCGNQMSARNFIVSGMF